MAKRNYYEVMGIDPNLARANPAEFKAQLKKIYRKLAMENHPDKHPDNEKLAKERFQEIAEAYEHLEDDAKRADYNRTLYTRQSAPPPPPRSSQRSTRSKRTQPPPNSPPPSDPQPDDEEAFYKNFRFGGREPPPRFRSWREEMEYYWDDMDEDQKARYTNLLLRIIELFDRMLYREHYSSDPDISDDPCNDKIFKMSVDRITPENIQSCVEKIATYKGYGGDEAHRNATEYLAYKGLAKILKRRPELVKHFIIPAFQEQLAGHIGHGLFWTLKEMEKERRDHNSSILTWAFNRDKKEPIIKQEHMAWLAQQFAYLDPEMHAKEWERGEKLLRWISIIRPDLMDDMPPPSQGGPSPAP